MRLDIDSLRTLRAIVESGSFTGAAARLHLTQSAVSWKLKRLEERLGHALLGRDGKPIEPTEMRHDLLMHAERSLLAHDDAVASLKLRELTGTVLPIGLPEVKLVGRRSRRSRDSLGARTAAIAHRRLHRKDGADDAGEARR